MDLGLTDKVIMVAAASKGLGYGIAEAAASAGAKLSIASRTQADIEAAAQSLRDRYGVAVKAYVFDAAEADSIQAWTDATLQDFGHIDGLVVNAGGPPPGKFDDFGDDAWEQGFNITLMSAVRLIRAALPAMRQQGSGSIVTITSSSIKEPIDVLLLSNVFRSGVVSLVKSLSSDLAAEGIRINNLVPGRIDTDRVQSLDSNGAQQRGVSVAEQRAAQEAKIPMQRYGRIDEFGQAGAFLLSDAASYITGTTLTVDGGSMKTVW